MPAAFVVCQRSLTSRCAGTSCARASLKMATVGDSSGPSSTIPARSARAAATSSARFAPRSLPTRMIALGGNVARFGQILDSGVSVFAPSCLAGMREMALAIAAIVEGKDVQPCVVEPGKGIDSVAEIAVSAVQINSGEARRSRCWNPPAAQLRFARRIRGKADGVEREIYAGRRARHGGCWVIEQLPAALPEKDAQRTPCAEQRAGDGEASCAEQPLSRDGRRSRRAIGATRWKRIELKPTYEPFRMTLLCSSFLANK